MLLPQYIVRTLFPLVVCVTFLLASIATARAENIAARKSEHATGNQQLMCNVTRLRLGEVVVGRATGKLVTITNRRGTSLTVLSAASTNTEFGMNGLDLPLTLAAGESFTFEVTFAPQRSGPADGSISIVSGAPRQTLTIALAGAARAAGQLQVSPAAIDFRDANVGATETQRGQVTANGANVTVSSVTIGNENFRWGGPSLPFTIPAGHSLSFTVTFVPRNSESASTVLSFVSDAEISPTEQTVTAGIVGHVRHKVLLSWKASKSKHVTGYNIYRGNRAGGPYKRINAVLDPNTRFTDGGVAAGHKYYYVTTAVNRKKRESVYSKQIEVVIPLSYQVGVSGSLGGD